jgi:hypothetical protein
MDAKIQQQLLLAQVQSMLVELDERLGDENPWRLIDFTTYTISDLAAVKKLMHELLYAPPPRGR